jgi:hypothetical protein
MLANPRWAKGLTTEAVGSICSQRGAWAPCELLIMPMADNPDHL